MLPVVVGFAVACNAILGIEDVALDPNRGDAADAGPEAGDPTCAPSPRDDPKVIREACGIFATPNGSDANAGTRTSPVKTLRHALELASAQRLGRVYLCASTYPEQLLIAHEDALFGISVYGGLSCPDGPAPWTFTGEPAKVQPKDASLIALRVDDAPGQVTIDGIQFAASDAAEAGKSSVAGYVTSSSSVAIRHASLAAGSGRDATSAPAADPPTQDPSDFTGNSGNANGHGGPAKVCSCKQGQVTTTTTGGKGGDSDAERGGSGLPALGGGLGGANAPSLCGRDGAQDGGSGAAGANGAPGKHGTDAGVGSIGVGGWTPAQGLAGENGGIGQGGGGGRGGTCSDPPPDHAEGGGGGGCGGCGGTGGAGGAGGGASIALLLKDANVSLLDVALTAKVGGGGARGTTGLDAPALGTAGQPGLGACGCPGGNGGQGGHGGSGGGGAGGVSVGIVYSGPVPVLDALTQDKIHVAHGGAGGPGGDGAEPGRDGVAQPTLNVGPTQPLHATP